MGERMTGVTVQRIHLLPQNCVILVLKGLHMPNMLTFSVPKCLVLNQKSKHAERLLTGFVRKKQTIILFLTAFFFILPFCLLTSSCSPEKSIEKKSVWIESWKEVRPLNEKRVGAASGVYGAYIFVAGGASESDHKGLLDTVEFTKVRKDGSLAPWRYTKKLSAPRVFAAGIVHNDTLYVIGGESGLKDQDLLTTVERTRILSDGSLEYWVSDLSKMSTPRRSPVPFIIGNRLYVSGGYNGKFLTDVESTPIRPDGSLGRWRNESADMEYDRYIHTGVVYEDTVFLFGGHSTKPGGAYAEVEWTRVNPEDGFLDLWKEAPKMDTRRYLNGIALHNSTVYLIGGRNTVLLTEVGKARFLASSAFKPESFQWESDTPMATPREGLTVSVVGDFIYAVGGRSFEGILSSVEMAEIQPGRRLGYWGTNKEKLKKKVSPIPEDAISHFTLANEYAKFDHLDSAIREMEEGIRLSPDTPEAYFFVGKIYLKKHVPKMAQEAFLRAVRLKPDYRDALYSLGASYYELKQFGMAIDAYERLLEFAPSFSAGRRNLATTYLDTEQFGLAIKHLEVLIKESPDDEMLKGFLKYAKEMLPGN